MLCTLCGRFNKEKTRGFSSATTEAVLLGAALRALFASINHDLLSIFTIQFALECKSLKKFTVNFLFHKYVFGVQEILTI